MTFIQAQHLLIAAIVLNLCSSIFNASCAYRHLLSTEPTSRKPLWNAYCAQFNFVVAAGITLEYFILN